jgi:hypothetical protein
MSSQHSGSFDPEDTLVFEGCDVAEFAHEIPVPDALDLVVEVGAMMAIHSAQLFERVDIMRRWAVDDAVRHGHQLSGVIERSLRLELASALGMTEASADRLISRAEALVHRYPQVLDSLAGARMTSRRAEMLVDGLDMVEPELRGQMLVEGLALAEMLPDGTFRRRLQHLIDTIRATTLEKRHAEALDARRVVVEPADDGMAWLHAYMPAVEAHAIHGRVTAMAKALLTDGAEDDRTLDQRRADVLGDLLVDGVTDALSAEARGIRASVSVTVPVLSLMSSGERHRGDGFATVEGIGPIPMGRARELCGGSADWLRVLTHPETGMVLSVGRTRYRPPAELRRLVRWRAETCMGPGCNIPASRCEIDHNVAWEHGGRTELTNLTPLCKGHHIVKHHGRWRVRQLSGGTLEWTSPSGREYRVEPTRRVPAFAE